MYVQKICTFKSNILYFYKTYIDTNQNKYAKAYQLLFFYQNENKHVNSMNI